MKPSNAFQRAAVFLGRRHSAIVDDGLGVGKDGDVFFTSESTVVKVHDRQESYQNEVRAFLRLLEANVVCVGEFELPTMLDFDDELLIIEMSLVNPPFIVDFASAIFDAPPDLTQDEGHTLEDLVRERFDDRADEVMNAYYELASKTGMYLTDLHPGNIKFK